MFQNENNILNFTDGKYQRRNSVMFSDEILLHGCNRNILSGSALLDEREVRRSEKMTRTGNGHIWLIPLSRNLQVHYINVN